MSTAAERKEKIAQIRKLPVLVANTVQGLNDKQLNTPYRDGGWTVRQVVHHLADSHMNAYIRTKLILTEENPTIKPYDQDEWAKLPDAMTPIEQSLIILKGLHDRWTALFETVDETAWARKAYHPERGEITLESILNIYSHHGANHVEQIAKLRAAKGW